jgi:GAF domain-containing protein
MADYEAQPGHEPPEQPDLSAAQREADEVDLYASLRGVAGIVAGARGVIDLLRDVAEFAAQAIPAVDGAGVALIEPRQGVPSVQTWATTAVLVQEIDAVQYDELNEGPCITCMQSRRPAVSGSLGSDIRWPQFGGRVARMQVHSALSLPLIVGDQVIGAINAYARHRDAFGEHAVRLGSQFAGPAAVSVYNAQLLARAQERTARLQRALGSRAVIDQAIGVIRSRSGVGAEVAFDRLVRMSQAENIKLHVVAERMVEEAARRARARQGQP